MTSDGRTVGVPELEATPSVEMVVAAVESAGGDARVAAPAALADAELRAIVARGEAALKRVATQAPNAPVLPIDVDPGIRSVPEERLHGAIESVLAGQSDVEHHPIVGVGVDGARVGAFLRDATLLTAEPARISEFAIESEAVGFVDEIRSDGVVVAAPAGSHGYAAAGDGPLLAPGTGLGVVPIAPFRIDRTRWVLPNRPLSVAIQRDEAEVTVEVDGVERQTVGKDATVTFEPADALEVLVVEESEPLLH